MNTKTNKNILILGAGFAGLTASKELGTFGKVTVIDPTSSFEFAPNIHELVSGFKSPADVRLDTRGILEGRGQEFVQEKAVELNRENKIVSTSSGTQYHYDCLIVAIGGVSNDRGVSGVKDYASLFKSASDCHAIGQKLEHLECQDSPYSVTIVGGGVEGVECLGEILRKYSGSDNLSINLVEGDSQLLSGMSHQVHQDILELCQRFSISFHFEKRVRQVEAHQVILSNGKSLPSDLTIWTGGVKFHPQLEVWGLAEPSGWPQVNTFLQSKQDSDILIIGDAVDVMGGGEKQAYLALEMGQIAGYNARSILQGKRLKAYKPKSLPSVYSFGNLSCFIVYKGFSLSGLPFAGLKEAIYQLNMASMQDACARPEKLIDTLDRGLNGAIGSFHSIIESPIPLFSRFSIGFFIPTIFNTKP